MPRTRTPGTTRTAFVLYLRNVGNTPAGTVREVAESTLRAMIKRDRDRGPSSPVRYQQVDDPERYAAHYGAQVQYLDPAGRIAKLDAQPDMPVAPSEPAVPDIPAQPEPPKRKPGRPRGSKNRPKVPTEPATFEGDGPATGGESTGRVEEPSFEPAYPPSPLQQPAGDNPPPPLPQDTQGPAPSTPF